MKRTLLSLLVLIAFLLIQAQSVRAQIAPGSALDLNGTSGYAALTLAQPPTNNYTISAWVYLRSGGVFANPRIAVVSSTACGGSVEFLIRGAAAPGDPQYLQLGRCFQFEGATSTTPVPLNTWVQISVSVASGPASNTVSFFINGAPAGTSLLSNTNDVSLGASLALGYNNGTSRKFDGLLDEVQIWKAVVLPVTNHVISGAEPNLVAYYRFDEGAGTTAANIALAGGANATLTGGSGWSVIPPHPLPPGSPLISEDWVAQGPAPAVGPYTSTGILVPPDYAGCGNVRAVATHPIDPNIIYIGAPNGGIWKTVNATATIPSWIPLTDFEPSLSISSLEFDPTDVNHQTLLAGIGSYSASGQSGAMTGLLRSADGGVSWTRISPTNLVGVSLICVAARGSVLLAGSAESGLYRSTNGGVSFTNLAGAPGTGLPVGGVDAVAGVVGNPSRLYAASRIHGIYRSDDTGATWINTSSGITDPVTGCGSSTYRVALSVHTGSGVEVVYAAVANPYPADPNRSTRTYIYFSTNSAVNWNPLGPVLEYPSLGIYLYGGPLTLSLGADPTNASLVYVGGSYGVWGGEIVRVNRSQPSNTRFANLFPPDYPPNPAVGRTTHADSHVITFDTLGNLIQSDDGGIFLLPYIDASSGTNGIGPGGGWHSLIGNLTIAEFYSIAYDPHGKVLMGGTQDLGTFEQRNAGLPIWDIAAGGDGGAVAVDARSSPGYSFRYVNGASEKKTYNSTGQFVTSTVPALNVLAGSLEPSGSTMELNAVDPRRFIIGAGNAIFESTDQGETLRPVASFYAVNIARMVYGGYLNGVPNPDVIWACGNIIPSPSYYSILLRTNAAAPAQFLGVLANQPLGIVANTSNWQEAYYITQTSVLQTTNAGQTWTDITANLAGGGRLTSIEFLPLPAGDVLAVGTADGVYVTRLGANPRWWTRLGSSLPRTIAFGLRYDPSDQILAVGTLGRGAWTCSLAGWPQAGGPGSALNLSEASSNYVTAHLNAALTDNYTIGAWISLRSGGTFPNPRVAIISSTNCGDSVEFLIRSATTNITDPQYLQLARCNQFGGALSTVAVPLNQWVYVAVTVGPTLGSGGSVSNLVTYYINGTPAGANFFANVNLTIGPDIAIGLNNGSTRKFDGMLDQVRVWSNALIPSSIPVAMTGDTADPLVLSCTFDEGTGTAIQGGPASANLVGSANWAPSGALFKIYSSASTRPAQNITSSSATLILNYSANSEASAASAVLAYGLLTNYDHFVGLPSFSRTTPTLNGFSDFITSSQLFVNPQTFSISLWFKTTSKQGGRLIGFGDSQTNASSVLDRHLYIGTDGLVRFGVYGDTFHLITGGPACNDGRWHYAAGTFSPGDGMRLYIDGAQVATNALVNPNSNTAFVYDGYWRLGWDEMSNWPGASPNSHFAGGIAEAQIWDSVLAPTQIATTFDCSLTGNEPGLATYYRLDEGGGAFVTDSAATGGSNTGLVVGSPAWTTTVDLPVCLSATITNLEPATTYYFAALTTNGAGTYATANRSFTTKPPNLSGSRTTNSILLSWSLPATGFLLEQSGVVNAPAVNWNVIPPPYTTNGTFLQSAIPLSGQATFFRLRRP